MCAEPSTIAASTTAPLPVERAFMMALSTPMVRYRAPPAISPRVANNEDGGVSGVPL
ncbi:hypothetical protein D3C76_1819350 [compost metagenome]